MTHPTPGQRIAVIGVTGVGKSTLAAQIAARRGVPHIELDALHWRPGWTEAPLDEFRRDVSHALAGDAWVVDGNYSKVRDVVWGRADTIVWLDYALPVILARLTRRTWRRVVRREELWAGNRESWRNMFSRHSLYWWALKTYPRHRRDYPALLAQPAYAHLRVIRFRAPHEAAQWLAGL